MKPQARALNEQQREVATQLSKIGGIATSSCPESSTGAHVFIALNLGRDLERVRSLTHFVVAHLQAERYWICRIPRSMKSPMHEAILKLAKTARAEGGSPQEWNTCHLTIDSSGEVDDATFEHDPALRERDWNNQLLRYDWLVEHFPDSQVGYRNRREEVDTWLTTSEYQTKADTVRRQAARQEDFVAVTDKTRAHRHARLLSWGRLARLHEPLFDPRYAGGPAWPSRPAWQVIEQSDLDWMTLIMSDGLTDPWNDQPGGLGIGVEVATIGPVPPDEVEGSWLLHLATQLSHNAVHHGAWADLVERDGTISIQLEPVDDLTHLATETGAIGVLLAPWRTLELPNGDATVLAATLLTPDEFDHVTRPPNDQRATARRDLLDRLEAADVAHRCLPDRPSVLA